MNRISSPHSGGRAKLSPAAAKRVQKKSSCGVTAVSSKLKKTRVLTAVPELSKHVPSTKVMTRSSLLSMLERCGMVYVKPDTGSMGVGVMRVERKEGAYMYQSGDKVKSFSAYSELYRSLIRQAGSRRYLVQKGIHVLSLDDRPYDFRIMIQRSPSRRWECTGTAARVASIGKIVSNGSQGGTIYSPEELLTPVAGAAAVSSLLKQMDRLALRTARAFGRTYPAMNELGLDIAVDRDLKPWILEVNTRPDPCPFTKLKDRAPINRIVRYAKAYGRRYSLVCGKAKKAP